MKKIYALFFVLLPCLSFGQNYFQKIFGDSLIQEKGFAVHQFADGTIYYFGSSLQDSNGIVAVTMHRLAADGSVLSKKTFATTGMLMPMNMLFDNGTFIIIGEFHDLNSFNIDGFVMRVDTAGQVLHYQTFGGSSSDFFNGIIKTTDGGFILTGFSGANAGRSNDFWVVKLTADLSTVEWQSIRGSALNDVGMQAAELSNGNIFVVGDQQRPAGNYNVYTQFYSTDGRFLFEKTVEEPFTGGSKSVLRDSNGDLVIIGEMTTASSFYFDLYMVKMTENGTVLWSKFLTNTQGGDAGFGIIEPTAGDYVVVGYGENPMTLSQDIILLTTDTSGTVVETKFYGGNGIEIGYGVTPSVNGGFLVAGFTTTSGAGDYFLIYDAIQLAVRTTAQIPAVADFSLFPNPVRAQHFYFSTPLKAATLLIFDSNGRQLESAELLENTTSYTLQNHLAKGQYFAHFQFGSFTKTIQFLVSE